MNERENFLHNKNRQGEITLEEVKTALKNMKNKKAHGPDFIPIDIIINSWDIMIKWLTDSFQKTWMSGEKPSGGVNLSFAQYSRTKEIWIAVIIIEVHPYESHWEIVWKYLKVD